MRDRAAKAFFFLFCCIFPAHGFSPPQSSLQQRTIQQKPTLFSSSFAEAQSENVAVGLSSSKKKQEGKAPDQELLTTLDEEFQYSGRLYGSKYEDYRCGYVSILGAPNMGKSTLLNALLQEDLCIATARPQTTRHAILGLLTTNNCQVCLVDTPGIIENPSYKLQEGMMEAVIGAFHDADVLLVVTDLFSTPIPDDSLFRKVQQSPKPCIVVINKIDLADKVNIKSDANKDKTVTVEQAVALWRHLLPNAIAIMPCNSLEGKENCGVVALRTLLTGGPDVPAAVRSLGRPIDGMFQPGVKFVSDEQARALFPLSPPLYDEDILTDRTERFIASEMIRAALFQSLKKELPYCCEVQITDFKEPSQEDDKKVVRIAATVIVERDSQKSIVIGKGGEMIKEVGMQAREKLEDFLQTQVFLLLNVKVDKGWRKDTEKLKRFGYLRKS